MNQPIGPYEITMTSDHKVVERVVGLGIYLWLFISVIGYLSGAVPSAGSGHDDQAAEQRRAEFAGLIPKNSETLATLAYTKPTPESLPLAPVTDWGTGTYVLEGSDAPAPPGTRGDIGPGLYATPMGVSDCEYQLWREPNLKPPYSKSTYKSTDSELAGPRVIGEDHIGYGRMLVSLNNVEPDWFTSSEGCIGWSKWTRPDAPLTRAGNGDYWSGDLEVGEWNIPKPCRWSKVVAFRGAALHDIADSGANNKPLVIDEHTMGVSIRGCMAGIVPTLAENNRANSSASDRDFLVP